MEGQHEFVSPLSWSRDQRLEDLDQPNISFILKQSVGSHYIYFGFLSKEIPYACHYMPWLVYFFNPFPKTIYVL